MYRVWARWEQTQDVPVVRCTALLNVSTFILPRFVLLLTLEVYCEVLLDSNATSNIYFFQYSAERNLVIGIFAMPLSILQFKKIGLIFHA